MIWSKSQEKDFNEIVEIFALVKVLASQARFYIYQREYPPGVGKAE